MKRKIKQTYINDLNLVEIEKWEIHMPKNTKRATLRRKLAKSSAEMEKAFRFKIGNISLIREERRRISKVISISTKQE